MAKAKKPSKPKKSESSIVIVKCNDCKIQLGIKKEEASCCGLCKSSNVTIEPWR